MPTLILTPRFTADAQSLWRAAARLGWGVERLAGWHVPDHLRSVAEPVLYLEGLFGPTLAESFGLSLPEPPVDWLPTLPAEYLRRTIALSTLGAARRSISPTFVKPPNEKSFPARVYGPGELPADDPDGTPVLVAEPVRWECEFRCRVLDREVRTSSIYLRGGELQRDNGFAHTADEDQTLRQFMTTLLADPRVKLGRTAVVDVGVIAGRGWAVVEQNAAWGSGIYGCDPVEVLHVLRHAAERLWFGL